MEAKSITELEFSTVEDYVNAIVAHADNDAIVHTLVLQAAKSNVLPFLWGVDHTLEAFSRINPDLAKASIVESMFNEESNWLCKEEEKKEQMAGMQAIESFLDLEGEKTQSLKEISESILTLENDQAHYKKRQHRILSRAKKLNSLPSEMDVDRCQPNDKNIHPCKGMSTEEAILKHKEGIKAVIRSFDAPEDDIDTNGLRDTLIFNNRTRFLKRLREAVCQISLKSSEEERQLLLQNLQKARLHKVVTAVDIKNDDDEFADGNTLGKYWCYELINKDFRTANLTEAQFRASGLDGALFQGATLEKTNFRCAILTNANFTKANLKGANLGSASLEGAVFDGANLQCVNLKNIRNASEKTTFQLDALLTARSLVGILIKPSTLKRYTREEQKNLRDKLAADYQSFFESSEDVNELIETVYLMSPHTSLLKRSTLEQLNELLGEDRAFTQSLLDTAHTRVEKLIRQGERVTRENIEHLKARYTNLSDWKERTIFGYESLSRLADPLLAGISKNFAYYQFLDVFDEFSNTYEEKDSTDEKIQHRLISLFDAVAQLWKRPHPHANKAFTAFHELLYRLYGDNVQKRTQTLISLFLGKWGEIELRSWPHEAFVNFIDGLIVLDEKSAFASLKDKWVLILALLNGLSGETIERFKNIALINLMGSSDTHESPKKILGVEAILSCQELGVKIDRLVGLLNALSNATVINENDEQDAKANDALKKAEALFQEIFKQKTAIYEQIIMNPISIDLVNLSDGEKLLKYLPFFQAEKIKLFALINESGKADGDVDALYAATHRLENLKTARQTEIAIFVNKLARIKEEFQTYRDSLAEKQALLLEVLVNFINQESSSTELLAKAPLKTVESQTLPVLLENFPGSQEKHSVPVNLSEPPASPEISITVPIETLFELEDQEKVSSLLTEMPSKKVAVENKNVFSTLKRNLELNDLMTWKNNRPYILYQWYLLQKKNSHALTEDEQAKLSIYVQIRAANQLSERTVYTEAVGEILSILEAYVEALNQLPSESEQYLPFQEGILEILISLDKLLYQLDQLTIKSAAGADLDNLLTSINDECRNLNNTIQKVETTFQPFLDKVPSLMKKLDSQVKIAQGYGSNTEQFDRLAHRLNQAQYSLYAAVLLCVVSAIIVATLVAAPYLAVPAGIALLALVASEVVRREKNAAEEKRQANETALSNMPSTLSGYTSRYFDSKTQLFFNQQKDSVPQQIRHLKKRMKETLEDIDKRLTALENKRKPK